MKEETSFGQWLRKKRRALDLSRQAFANQVGCAEVTLRRIEAGTLKPSQDLASILLGKLGISQAELPQWISFARGISGLPVQSLPQANKPITSISTPLTSFIGREKEVKEVTDLLSRSRLVTLTGSGGVGKTRLAIHAVANLLDELPDGVLFLDLVPISNPEQVPFILAEVLDLQLAGDSSMSITDMLVDYLRLRNALIIFDNCEHLIDGCARLVDSLLNSCKGLHILATSREALHVPGEITYRVPSLAIPVMQNNILEELTNVESFQLFIERAKAILPNFAVVQNNAHSIAQICQRLDGIPLAIELAAARIEMLSLEQIAGLLDDHVRLLGRGPRTVLPRHQTMRAVIDWSYELLSSKEQTLLQRLSVFAGSWTLDAAKVVCDHGDILDLLAQLVDKSLVTVNRGNDEARYGFLETIHQYAHERLAESGEAEQIRDRHLDYFLKFAQRAEPELYSKGQIEWAQKLEDEHKNMRAALEWSLQRNAIAGQELTGALCWSWYLNGHLREGYEWIEKMLTVSSEEETRIRAKLLSQAGWFAGMLGYYGVTRSLSEESVILFRKLGDEVGTAFPLCNLGGHFNWPSDYVLNTRLAMESLDIYRRAGDQWGVSRALNALGYNALMHDDFEQARNFLEESLSIGRETGDYEGVAWTLLLIAGLPQIKEDVARAMELCAEALEFAKIVKAKPMIAHILTEMGELASYIGDYQRGRQLLDEAMDVHRKMGDRVNVARAFRYLAWTARLQGDYIQARSLYLESLQMSQRIQNQDGITATLIHIGNLLLVEGSPEKFVRMLGAAERTVPKIRNTLLPSFGIETENFIEIAKATLDNAAYAAAYEAGQQMGFEESVAYGLKELQ